MNFKQYRKYIIAIILLLCFLTYKNIKDFNWQNWANKTSKELMEDARKNEEKHQHDIANFKYSIVILIGNDYYKSWAYNCRGSNTHKKVRGNKNNKYFKQAFSDYDNAIKYSKQCYPAAIGNKGLLYSKIGNLETAINYYNEAIQCDAKYQFAWSNKVDDLFDAKRYSEAIETGLQAIEKFGPNDEIYFDIAYSYEMIGNHKKAIEYYDKELKMNNYKSWWTLTNASYCKLMLKDYDGAIEYATKSIQLWDKNIHPYNFVAFAAIQKGNLDLAIQYNNLAFNKAYKENYLTFYNYAYIKHLQGDNDGARQRLDKARHLFAKDTETWQFEGFETLCNKLESKL